MLTAAGKLLYLNSGDVEPVKVVLHSAEPNATGTTNRIGTLLACSFNAATVDERVLSVDVITTIPAGITTATHFSVYNASDVALHISPLTTPRSGLVIGDTVTLKTSDTKITIP